MQFNTRRIVTGHNDDGKAVVLKDDVLNSDERWPGMNLLAVWATSKRPVSNNSGDELVGVESVAGERIMCRMASFNSPGLMHRTQSLDFGVVLEGGCDMELDSGEIVRGLKVGDVVIQRGTNHSWVTPGSQNCKMMFVVVDAQPVSAGDKVLGNMFDNFKAVDPQFAQRLENHKTQVLNNSE